MAVLTKIGAARCLATMAIIAAVALASLAGFDRYGRNRRVYGFAGAIDAPGVPKLLVAQPSQAYQSWQRAGFRGRTVVFFTDSWASFSPHALETPPVSRPYPLELYNLAQENQRQQLNDVSFIYVAYLNGIVRRLVAVLPPAEYAAMVAKARSSKNYRLAGDQLYYPFEAFPRSFCADPGSLAGGEPVLVVLNASFFRQYQPDQLYSALTRAKLRTDSIVLCLETGRESVSPAETAKLARFAQLVGLPVAAAVTPHTAAK